MGHKTLELGERPAINVTAQLSRDGERAPLKTKRSKRRVIITAELARELGAQVGQPLQRR
jgi:ABC-type lipoprotein release transport system permease subunit